MEKKKLSRVLSVAAAVVLCLGAVLVLRNNGNTQMVGEVVAAAVSSQSVAQDEPLTVADAVPASPQTDGSSEGAAPASEEARDIISESGAYTSRDDVALYIHTYGHLPSNFIKKADAESLGWPGGSLEPYAPGKSIGGDRFGNREGLLPKKSGRTYTECDIDTAGKKSRGAKRIVFSNDGLVYYTADHYESFELLYGEE